MRQKIIDFFIPQFEPEDFFMFFIAFVLVVIVIITT